MSSLKAYLIFLNIVLCFHVITSHTCHSFKNVTVLLHQKSGDPFNKTVNGCIERIEFNEKNVVTEAYIRNQSLPTLGRESVRNMVKLKTLVFWGCNIVNVESGAFRNLPRLKNLQISYGNLKEISRDVFHAAPTLELLRIHNNEIDIIADQALANLPGLKKIYAGNNMLEYWNREWFTNSTSLEIMDFQFNKIRTLPRRAFENLQNLKQIFFDYNEISNIHDNAFIGLKNLDYLGLRFNRLVSINENIFPSSLKIRSLLLDANYLNYLSNELLNKISVSELTLDGNPWKCPCLDRIHFWLHSSNGTLNKADSCTGSSIPDCAISKTYSTTCLETVDSDLTKKYIKSLRGLSKPLDKYCARTDYILIAV
ncbi:unnamed protein product [Brassicogethes aeneus]|uniref:Uncharacterized protein n=1 Tax=Brassicogethes aeneus TaxID=1431903 RepID=A0A9P0FFV1_BRAAE|nr:unnamed protein product [Brassicogethes aeneus]